MSLLCVLAFLCHTVSAQYVYTIKADSIKLTNCDSAELIIENHTQNVPGFLFNTGNGRTVFKRALTKISDSIYLLGADTLKISGKPIAGNGLHSVGDSILLGGIINQDTKIDLTPNNNKLWIKTSFRSDYDGTKTGVVVIGDTNFTAGPQSTAGLVVSKTKENQAENVNLLGLTTGDAPGPNGWLFADYTNVSGYVTPRLQTFSNAGNTSWGFEHDCYFSSTTPSGYILYLYDYDTLVAGGNNQQRINTTSPLYGIINGYSPMFIITGAENTCVGWSGGDNLLAKLQVNGAAWFSDSVMIPKAIQGTSADDVLVINSTTHAVHKIPQSSLAFNGVLNSPLAVNSTITAKELKLTAKNWPDYVFDSAYRIPALTSLEKYIQQHHHLPGIPSAAVIEKTGTNVGETQAALLKKIEELTLYTIDQDKKLTDQKNQIDDLKNRLETLEHLIGNKTGNKQ
jgi:hypothetical protein